jgi:hypothetical protein
MVKTSFDGGGILARKLNTFLPLTSDELNCLAEIQSQHFRRRRHRRQRRYRRASAYQSENARLRYVSEVAHRSGPQDQARCRRSPNAS